MSNLSNIKKAMANLYIAIFGNTPLFPSFNDPELVAITIRQERILMNRWHR
jgi:hypothetical protein